MKHVPPDHPWNPDLSIEGWCEICGSPEIVHDGNLERVFDWLSYLGDLADGRIPQKEEKTE